MHIFDFLCVHPFHDGNGRVSRLLMLSLAFRRRSPARSGDKRRRKYELFAVEIANGSLYNMRRLEKSGCTSKEILNA